MRKTLTLALALSLMTIATPVSNASDAELGKRCKKVGLKANDDGQSLICKKKGKRNVWTLVANEQSSAKPTATQSAAPSTSEAPATKGFTKAEVEAKNSNSACWTIVGNKVYDLTQWISRHPGGSSSIASLCGIDGTSRFRGQHGSSGRPNSQLDSYYIGDLKG
jgi:cytochrome b involved in lipid metabolism